MVSPQYLRIVLAFRNLYFELSSENKVIFLHADMNLKIQLQETDIP